MPYPGLVQEDHQILGSEYCSGYTDVFGKWNTGFYCPQTGSNTAVFCCGTPYLKYCCISRSTVLDDEDETEAALLPYTVRIPVFFAIFCGVLAIVFLLITAVCFFCSCCFVYKKRRDEASTGLYRIQGSSSTASALASIYSNQHSSVVTTPQDTDWTSQLPFSSYSNIPYPLTGQQGTPQLSSLSSPYHPSSAIIPSPQNNNNNNNNNLPPLYYNNLAPRGLTSHNSNNNNNRNAANAYNNSHFSSLSSLYRYPAYQRPLSAASSRYSSNSTLTLPVLSNPSQIAQLSQIQQNLRPINPTGTSYNNANNLRNGGFCYRPPGTSPLVPQSMNSFLNPFSYGQVQQNNFNQIRPRHLLQQQQQQQQSQYQQNGYQSHQPLPCSNNNDGSNRRGRTPGNQPNQEQQDRLATVQSLINAYRASVNSATAAVMRTCPASYNNSDVNRLNEINLLFSTVLNQNRRPGSAGGGGMSRGSGNANSVIRTSGESATTNANLNRIPNINNSNSTIQRNTGSVSEGSEHNLTDTMELTRSASVACLDSMNGNSIISSPDPETTLPSSTDDNGDSKGKAAVATESEPEEPDVAIEVDSVKSGSGVSVPVSPEGPPGPNCVELETLETCKPTGGDDDDGGNLRINETKNVEKLCKNFDKELCADLPTGAMQTESLES